MFGVKFSSSTNSSNWPPNPAAFTVSPPNFGDPIERQSKLATQPSRCSLKHCCNVLLYMRGPDQKQDAIFSYLSPEERVPADHPLRKIRALVDGVLKDMSPQFGKNGARAGSRSRWTPTRLTTPKTLPSPAGDEDHAARGPE